MFLVYHKLNKKANYVKYRLIIYKICSMINKIKIERGKNMKILAVGDLIGSAGIRKLKSVLPELRKKEGIDFVIVNGENSAEGMGMTEKNFKEILEEKVDVITMGNHTWGKKDIFKFLHFLWQSHPPQCALHHAKPHLRYVQVPVQ